MQDWQIKPLSKKSSLTDREIKSGDVVVCAVFINELGQLDRLDIHKDEFDNSKINGKFIGKWERVVGDSSSDAEFKRMSLASSEDFFVSLFDNSIEIDMDEIDIVKQMLALLLERKRILKPLGRPKNNIQTYIQQSTKREFLVNQKDINEELVFKIQNQLGSIII